MTDTEVRTVRTPGPQFVSRLVDPVHLLAVSFGFVLLVLGLVALVRTGVPSNDLTRPVVTVGWLQHTPLLALIHLAVGAMLVSAAAAPALDRGAEVGLATFAGLIGVVLLIEPTAFNSSLATGSNHGWTYLGGGVALLLGTWVAPIWRTNRAR